MMAFRLAGIAQARFWTWALIVLCSSGVLIGCGGGTGGSGQSRGGNFPVPTLDLHSDIPILATVIIPDGANAIGAINNPQDTDWFTFRAIQGVTYVLQVFGFPTATDPVFGKQFDLTGEGDFPLGVQIVSFDGVTQLANSSGNAGGQPRDIPAAGSPGRSNFGDSRFIWVSPTTNDFFIRLRHSRPLTGIGTYEFRVATFQLGTKFGDAQRSIGTVFVPEDDMCNCGSFHTADARVQVAVDIPDNEILVVWQNPFPPLFLPDNDEPEMPAVHVHVGVPNVGNPPNTSNGTLPSGLDDPHPVAFDIPLEVNGLILPLPPDFGRLMTGFPWYIDIHATDDLDLVSQPVAVSAPFGGMYDVFESDMFATPANIVTRAGEPLPESVSRGGATFTLKYDTSLKAFQVAMRTHSVNIFGNPATSSTLIGDGESFAGLPIRVHSGGPGQNGPIILDLGTMPGIRGPFAVNPVPGFRNVIKQLSDAEAETLRDAFYGNGFYVQVTTLGGLPLVRAEGNLAISLFDTADPFIPTARTAGDVPTKGTANFASDYGGGGQITVVSNGEVLGVLNDFLEEGESPAQGMVITDTTLAAEYWPGRYPYRAYAEDGTEWQGHFTVESGSGEVIVFSVD